MRITIVTGFFLPLPPLQGGAMEKIWLRLGHEFASRGHDVTFVSRRWPGLPNNEVEGRITHIRVPGMNHTRYLAINLLKDLLWGLRVIRALPPADFVICNTVVLPIYLRRLRPAAGRVLVSLGRMPKGQIRFYGAVDGLLASSQAVADRCRQEHPGIGRRTLMLQNPIDWGLHASAPRRSDHGEEVVIGYVGRINPEKGLEQLLDAAVVLQTRPSLPAWRLRLIGPVTINQGGGGERYRDRLIARYAPVLGERLEFRPPVFDPARLASEYRDLDVFCYPSLAVRGEGLSVAPLEAMAAGSVPVLSNLDCYRDMLRPGENGFVFDHTRPPAEVAQELGSLLERLLREASLRRMLSLAAQATARSFDYGETARGLLRQMERLTVSPSPA